MTGISRKVAGSGWWRLFPATAEPAFAGIRLPIFLTFFDFSLSDSSRRIASNLQRREPMRDVIAG